MWVKRGKAVCCRRKSALLFFEQWQGSQELEKGLWIKIRVPKLKRARGSIWPWDGRGHLIPISAFRLRVLQGIALHFLLLTYPLEDTCGCPFFILLVVVKTQFFLAYRLHCIRNWPVKLASGDSLRLIVF